MRAPRLTAVLVVTAAMSAACAGGGYSVPAPKPLPKLPDTTAVQDFSGVALAAVPGRTTTVPPRIGPGPAALKGTVAGPDGLVPGAVVHLERLTDAGTATLDLPTAVDGTWRAPNILGGRYRVRAYRAPDLALVKPAVFFLAGSENRSLDITLERYTGLVAIASIAPQPPIVDEPADLVVRIAQQSVDPSGFVRPTGVTGATAELVGSGAWRVETSNPSLTDVNGDVEWQVRCRASGEQGLAVLVNGTDTLALDIPACADVIYAPTDTTDTSEPTRRTTTTFRRPTTTTR